MAKNYRVALLLNANMAYDRGIITGISSFVKNGAPWSLFIGEQNLFSVDDFSKWQGDGVIADFDHPEIRDAIKSRNIPVVGIASSETVANTMQDYPVVMSDNKQIINMAARFLKMRRYTHLAFCGYPNRPFNDWSANREQLLRDWCERNQCAYSQFSAKDNIDTWDSDLQCLVDWLSRLPKPVGIIAANDVRARQLSYACQQAKINIPEEVSIMGIDDDELNCTLSLPTLTSVRQGTRAMGYLTASLLQPLMDGKNLVKRHHFVQPERVIGRDSTDFFHFKDNLVRGALSLIRINQGNIKVKQILAELGCSRGAIDNKFHEELGMSLHAYLLDTQLNLALELLVDTEQTLSEIAKVVGFSSPQYLSCAIKKRWNMTPGMLREQKGVTNRELAPLIEDTEELIEQA
ncbi:XylR family transcriptional regulator [Agarivorans sp. OAG1]|uniref:Xylose activator XylR n=1 Tax=Agarivorans albus MKT 106 TaxID=1331007 RepID=R9PTD3_AGAAL|nr:MULTISPECIES: XylR family transcriptional regulator [Agarivorans]MPW29799.1 helix-turn-helix domain-containing protein [Agarivorans sp. B2Z047]UQN43367.1 XylR family transcriptional regulator [Agarivorans sp. B2Z047]BEU05087.1 XylR family transcriptional regulator [Agarivorans sp. OAG1]GAD02221.1 xylose activator XylR [Agarivorans albus MKT 106]